jgi:hypothetical protein
MNVAAGVFVATGACDYIGLEVQPEIAALSR